MRFLSFQILSTCPTTLCGPIYLTLKLLKERPWAPVPRVSLLRAFSFYGLTTAQGHRGSTGSREGDASWNLGESGPRRRPERPRVTGRDVGTGVLECVFVLVFWVIVSKGNRHMSGFPNMP